MFKVEQDYKSVRSSRDDNIFDTYEEALAYAECEASTDYEGYVFYVHEIRAVVKAEPLKLPIKTAIVTNENAKELLLGEDKNES